MFQMVLNVLGEDDVKVFRNWTLAEQENTGATTPTTTTTTTLLTQDRTAMTTTMMQQQQQQLSTSPVTSFRKQWAVQEGEESSSSSGNSSNSTNHNNNNNNNKDDEDENNVDEDANVVKRYDQFSQLLLLPDLEQTRPSWTSMSPTTSDMDSPMFHTPTITSMDDYCTADTNTVKGKPILALAAPPTTSTTNLTTGNTTHNTATTIFRNKQSLSSIGSWEDQLEQEIEATKRAMAKSCCNKSRIQNYDANNYQYTKKIVVPKSTPMENVDPIAIAQSSLVSHTINPTLQENKISEKSIAVGGTPPQEQEQEDAMETKKVFEEPIRNIHSDHKSEYSTTDTTTTVSSTNHDTLRIDPKQQNSRILPRHHPCHNRRNSMGDQFRTNLLIQPATEKKLLRQSPEKWYRRNHQVIIEHDDVGEGICVMADELDQSPQRVHFIRSSSEGSIVPMDIETSNSAIRRQRAVSVDRPRIAWQNQQQQQQQHEEEGCIQTIADSCSVPNTTASVRVQDEKKENDDVNSLPSMDRVARFAERPPTVFHQKTDSVSTTGTNITTIATSVDGDTKDCLSVTESEVASVDGLPSKVRKRWQQDDSRRDRLLQSLDGVDAVPKHYTDETTQQPYQQHQPVVLSPRSSPTQRSHLEKNTGRHLFPDPTTTTTSSSTNPRIQTNNTTKGQDDTFYDWPFFDGCLSLSFWGVDKNVEDQEETKHVSWKETWKQRHDIPLALLDCANIIYQEEHFPDHVAAAPPVPTSLVRVAHDDDHPLSFADTIAPTSVDPRMQDWILSQFEVRTKPPRNGSYHLGKSRTVVVHEINRGNWTWCTAWSPDGALLAIATENHHLAVVDTTSSTVWRVRHDRRIRGPDKSNTTQSIRAISWGRNYIAIGGTGNAVSILAPRDPYQIVNTITGTGFVGSLSWRTESDVLAIGSRLDFVMIVRICTTDEDPINKGGKKVFSEVLHRIEYTFWVNCVSFSPDGLYLAVGDSGGIVSVYEYVETATEIETNMITWFKRKDSILSVEWAPDGKWLYAGGEDRSISVIGSTHWEIVHKIGRDRWVQCISSSYSGTHIAIGGVSSEISILDVEKGWDSVMGIELKGLVPLSAQWHPKDQYLALTGQNNSILVVETTNGRHVKGHHLHSISPILAIDFSPDGHMTVIGNKTGIVTFYSLSGTSFITTYELVVPVDDRLCIKWSMNGLFVIIGSSHSLMIIGRKKNKRQGKSCPPNASGFSVRKVIRDFGDTNAVSIDFRSHYVAVSGKCTRILDVRADFAVVREWTSGPYYANAWSPDGRWLAMIGKEKFLTIYDTSEKRVDRWRPIFSLKCDFVGLALTWGPLIVGGLLYLAYGGDSKQIYIMEIRTHEGTWETVLEIPRDDTIQALDWSTEGLLAAGIGNGTVGIVDLAYLQSGVAVNEMDYNWQRQALTCFTEIRRNRGKNSIQSLRWLPAAPGSDRLLAVGGTDGEVEIIDLTERRRCRGYVRGST